MPYIRRGGNQYVEAIGALTPAVIVTNVLTTYNLGTIYLPSFTGALSRVVAELYIGQIQNTSANENNINDDVNLWFNNGAWFAAFTVSPQFNHAYATSDTCGVILADGTDIKSEITSGATLTSRVDLKCAFDNMILYSIQPRIKLYFR